MPARAVAVLGTASDVGKSLIATALGRLLRDAGVDVAPFKAQNMALQAGVGIGGELGRAQILQAQACRVEPHVDMNPVLLKPRSDTNAEVVVLGQPQGTRSAADYFAPGRNPLADVALAALDRLAGRHAAIVIEGAGSPVELNLMERDFVNLVPARHVDAALVLVADVDRGGVFAQVKGTVDLLPPADRRRLIGIVVNRFRGDLRLFDDGVAELQRLTGIPVLAVVPWLRHGLDEEDRPHSLPIDAAPVAGRLNVGVLLHPHVSNTDDLAPLESEPDVWATWITDPRGVAGRDLLVLPGSKSTIGDLAHHTASGMAEALMGAVTGGAWALGLCGGYQMLGLTLADPHLLEGAVDRWPGLGLLPIRTRFEPGKTLSQRRCTSVWPRAGCTLSGYEIHHGHSEGTGSPLVAEGGAELGMVNGRVVGTYLHGLLADATWRSAFLNCVRADRGLPLRPVNSSPPMDARIDRWAHHVRDALRPGAWSALLNAVR